MASKFVAMVFAVLKEQGLDTENMSVDEAIAKYNKLNGNRQNQTDFFTGEQRGEPDEDFFTDKDDLTTPAKSNTIFMKSTPKEFASALAKAKDSQLDVDKWRVDIHGEADYSKDKLFTTSGGSCVAVEPSGNIISVCKSAEENIRGSVLLKRAVENGGDRLDAFGKRLFEFYTKNGFEPVSYTPFNEKYAPEDWKKGRDEAEPVIFYKYTGRSPKQTYEEFLQTTKPAQDYDTAQRLRDKEIK